MSADLNSAEVPQLQIISGISFFGLVPVPMKASGATATPLVKNKKFGMDEICLEIGGEFSPHTHEGDHILVIKEGLATLEYEGSSYTLQAGDICLIPGGGLHAIRNVTKQLVMLSISNQYEFPDSSNRLISAAKKEVTQPAAGGSPSIGFSERPFGIPGANSGTKSAPLFH